MRTVIQACLLLICFHSNAQTKQIALSQRDEASSTSVSKASIAGGAGDPSSAAVRKVTLPGNVYATVPEVDIFVKHAAENGGFINSTVRTALTKFVTSAKLHGYWNKLITVNALAGDRLDAALVQLKYPAKKYLASGTGYTSDDYSLQEGLRGVQTNYLDTKTNLAEHTAGTGGYHMWVGPGATGSIGLGNYAAPYSLVMLQAGTAVGYYGNATAGTNLDTTTDNFVQAVKQSLTSLKLFVNGVQRSVNNTATVAASRNEDIGIRLSGSLWFYAIDNGSLTQSNLDSFQADVKELMYDLGRKLSPPLFNKNGLYTSAQTLSIQAPKSATGAVVHYTTDGSVPAASSPVYNSPFTIKSTTRLKAVSVKNGAVSAVSEAWVSIVPPSYDTKKYYSVHLMVNLARFTDNMEGYVQRLKDAGYNLLWAHLDAYDNYYPEDLKRLMDAAEKLDIPVMPGLFQGGYVTSYFVDMMKDTWNHPALFRIDGKRCYAAWDYLPDNQISRDAALYAQTGISRNDYYLIANTRFPISYDGGKTFVGESKRDGLTFFTGTTLVTSPGQVHHMYETRPLDGYLGFLQEMEIPAIISTNTQVTKASRAQGKFCFPSVDAFYASTQFRYVGFKGMAQMWDSILAVPVSQRANGVVDITANDGKEISYMGPLERVPNNGIIYMPHPREGFDFTSSGIRNPWLDHSGPQAFVRPWIDAFLGNQPAPVFGKDRMFAWYWLHPKDVPYNPVIPEFYTPYLGDYFNQTWWNQSIFAKGSPEVASMRASREVAGEMDSISMAAHLSAPAQLGINGILSAPFPAGPAFFKIARESFLGVPEFSIVRGDEVVMRGRGLQPIVNNAFPGGWNYLSTEIIPAADASSATGTPVTSFSVIESPQAAQMMVYPNPVTDLLNVSVSTQGSGNYVVCLFNVSGKMVYNRNEYLYRGKNQLRITTKTLEKGMYIVKVYAADKTLVATSFLKK